MRLAGVSVCCPSARTHEPDSIARTLRHAGGNANESQWDSGLQPWVARLASPAPTELPRERFTASQWRSFGVHGGRILRRVKAFGDETAQPRESRRRTREDRRLDC